MFMKNLEFLRASTKAFYIDQDGIENKGIIETVRIKNGGIDYEINGVFYPFEKVKKCNER